MMICNYNVLNENGHLYFEECFDATCFSMNFQLDPENDLSPMGWINFEPEKRTATLYYYGHPEDLTPYMETYNLRDFGAGTEVLLAFNERKLGDLYRAAERFTFIKVNAHEALLNSLA